MNNITIISSITIALLTVGINIFIHTKLKFAQTEKEAVQKTTSFFINIGYLLAMAIIPSLFIIDVFSPSPIDKMFLLRLFCYFAIYLLLFFWYHISPAIELAKLLAQIHSADFEHVKRDKS